MSDTTPRPSNDLESSPLLGRRDGEEHDLETRGERTGLKGFMAALTDPSRELTAGEKLLGAVALIFLVLSAVFIGLFAGAKHRISEGLGSTTTITDYHTKTATATATKVFTSTVPGPGPTSVPLPPGDKTCLTSECVMLASSLLSYQDTSFDPCEDFVGYATAGWVKSNPLPKSKAIWGSFNQVQKHNQQVVLEILKRPIEIKSDAELKKETPEQRAEQENLVILKTAFNDCLDEDQLDKIGTGPLLDIVDHIQTLFPAVYPKSAAAIAVEASNAGKAWYSFAELEKNAKAAVDRIMGGEVASLAPAEDEVIDEFKGKDKEPSGRVKLTNVLAYLHAKDVPSLFEFNVEGDVGKDPQMQVLSFYQASTGLPAKPYYDEESIVAIYSEVMIAVLAELLPKSLLDSAAASLVDNSDSMWPPFPQWPSPGPKTPDTEDEFPAPETSRSVLLKKLVHQVVAFETQLAKIGADPEELFDPDVAYNPTPFDELDDALAIDLARYVSAFAPRNFPEKVIVTSPKFVRKLDKLLADTEDYILQAYFIARAGLKHANLLGPNQGVRIADEKLTSVLRGTKLGAEVDREEVCIAHVSAVRGHMVGAEFIKTQFAGDSKKKAENIIYGIIDEFKLSLKTLGWMDDQSRAKAIDKADAITPKVGYPLYPDHSSPLALQRYYARSPVVAGDFFGDVVASREAEKARAWQGALGNKRNVDIWEMNADTVNAYFSPPDNEIVFPAGILQPPFFSGEFPGYMAYASFGAVSAHELAHAFDTTGSKFDDEGFYRNWWSNSTVEAFQERADCLIEQYSKYSVTGPDGKEVYVNGNLTSGENIGDSGLKFAWNAWQTSLEKSNATDVTLPGLQYTHEQLFFLSFARIWASTASPAQAVAGVRTDPHSPNKFRIEGTLRNFPKFAETWQCKEGSRMNPKKRCELW